MNEQAFQIEQLTGNHAFTVVSLYRAIAYSFLSAVAFANSGCSTSDSSPLAEKNPDIRSIPCFEEHSVFDWDEEELPDELVLKDFPFSEAVAVCDVFYNGPLTANSSFNLIVEAGVNGFKSRRRSFVFRKADPSWTHFDNQELFFQQLTNMVESYGWNLSLNECGVWQVSNPPGV